jgi:hypothetical protein
MLQERLAQLTDRQIGQLMFDHFGHDLGILQPEMTICQHATQRLFRSAGGCLTAEDVQRQRPSCPQCGMKCSRITELTNPIFLSALFSTAGTRNY